RRPSASTARCNAAVQELNATACLAFTAAAKSSSKRLTFGPVVSQPERSVSTTSSISASVIIARKNATLTEGDNVPAGLIGFLHFSQRKGTAQSGQRAPCGVLTSTANKCVLRPGKPSSAVASAQLIGAIALASGGASVTDLNIPSRLAKSSFTSPL